MNPTTASVFLNRIKRVCLLDATVYHDARHSFLPAFLIVLLVALSHGAGAIIRANINHWDPLESFVFGVQGEIIFWLVQSVVYYAVAKWLLHHPARLVEILSSVGYAIFPGVLVFFASVLQIISLSVPLLIILAIYRLATCTLALHQLFRIKLPGAFLLVALGSAIGFFCLGAVIRLMEAVMN
jgi:hypothetical protein